MTNPKQKIIIGLILSVILVLILAGESFVLVKKIRDKAKQIEDQLNELALVKQNQNYKQKLEAKYEEIKDNIEKTKNGFLKNGQAIDFIETLENIAQLTGNKYEINIASSEKSDAFPTLGFRVSLWGNFPQTLHYLTRLENMAYWTRVNSLQFQKIGSSAIFQKKGFENLSLTDISGELDLEVFTQ